MGFPSALQLTAPNLHCSWHDFGFFSFLVLFIFTGGLQKQFFATIPRVEMKQIWGVAVTTACPVLLCLQFAFEGARFRGFKGKPAGKPKSDLKKRRATHSMGIHRRAPCRGICQWPTRPRWEAQILKLGMPKRAGWGWGGGHWFVTREAPTTLTWFQMESRSLQATKPYQQGKVANP